jgi:hypothetical protein
MKGNDMNMPCNNETAYFTGSNPVSRTIFNRINRYVNFQALKNAES